MVLYGCATRSAVGWQPGVSSHEVGVVWLTLAEAAACTANVARMRMRQLELCRNAELGWRASASRVAAPSPPRSLKCQYAAAAPWPNEASVFHPRWYWVEILEAATLRERLVRLELALLLAHHKELEAFSV
mmetsp:Transcript_64383/g.153563  ORF Transcript_64383/g.153563 Transcript_64383/m.153563 type:complete len:131 (+) Transcript_64383:465-857(+)